MCGECRLEKRAKLCRVRRRSNLQIRNEPQVGEVEDSMMRGTIRTGHAGAVDDEHNRKLVQRYVHDRLVKSAGEKCRVDADHRMHASHRETGGKRHRVLLADTDVEEAIRKFLREIQKAF